MSKEEVRKLIMVIVSGYLAYIGYRLIHDFDPSKSKIYLVAGVIFIIFGAMSVIHYIRNLIALRRMAGDQTEEPEPEPPAVPEDESDV